MISDAKSVTEYLKTVPEKRKAALTKFRQLCKEVLKGYEEGMAYGDQLIRKTKALKLDLQAKKIIFVFIV